MAPSYPPPQRIGADVDGGSPDESGGRRLSRSGSSADTSTSIGPFHRLDGSSSPSPSRANRTPHGGDSPPSKFEHYISDLPEGCPPPPPEPEADHKPASLPLSSSARVALPPSQGSPSVGCNFTVIGHKPDVEINRSPSGYIELRRPFNTGLTEAALLPRQMSGCSDRGSLRPSLLSTDDIPEEFQGVASTHVTFAARSTGGKPDEMDHNIALLHAKVDHMLFAMEENLRFTKALYKKTKKGLTEPGTDVGWGPFAKIRSSQATKTLAREHSSAKVPSGTFLETARLKRGNTGGTEVGKGTPYSSQKSKDLNSSSRMDLSRTTSKLDPLDLLEIASQVKDNRKSVQRNSSLVWRFFEDHHSSKWAACYAKVRSAFLAIAIVLAWIELFQMQGNKDGLSTLYWLAFPLQFIVESVFSLELIVRFISCHHKKAFWFTIYNWIDLASSIPLILRVYIFVLEKSGKDLSTSRGFHAFVGIVPVLRLLKSLRRFEHFQLLLTSFKGAFEALPVLIYTMMLICLSFASAVYYFEPRDNIPTMLTSVYFVIVTIGTVGYGDYTPKSVGGQVCILGLIVISSLYMAIPIGIVGYSFSQVWEDRHRLLLMQRMRNRLTSAGYTPKDLRLLFAYLDRDESGTLDFDEFVTIFDILEIDVEEKFIAQVFDCFDDDDEGGIDYSEFIRGLFPKTHWLMDAENHQSKLERRYFHETVEAGAKDSYSSFQTYNTSRPGSALSLFVSETSSARNSAAEKHDSANQSMLSLEETSPKTHAL